LTLVYIIDAAEEDPDAMFADLKKKKKKSKPVEDVKCGYMCYIIVLFIL
jgi:hypothetical protein